MVAASRDHSDYVSMPSLDDLKRVVKFSAGRDRVVTRFEFPGSYNKGRVNGGQPVVFDIAYFLDKDQRQEPEHYVKIAIRTVIAVYALACDMFSGKRKLGLNPDDLGEFVRSHFMWASNNGNAPAIQGILDETGCCGLGGLVPDHFTLHRRIIQRDTLYEEKHFVSETRKKALLIFQIPDNDTLNLLEHSGVMQVFTVKK